MLHLASATHHGPELNPNSLRSLTAYIYRQKIQATGYRLQATGYRLQATGYRLQAAACPMQEAGGRMQDARGQRSNK